MSTQQLGIRTIKASQLQVGNHIVYANTAYRERVIETSTTRDGQIKVHWDYGNGGEPATSFYDPDDLLKVC